MSPGENWHGRGVEPQARTLESRPQRELEALRREATRAREAASDEAQRIGRHVRGQAGLFAERGKSGLAGLVAEVAASVRSISDGLEDHPNLQALAHEAADRIRGAAATLDRKTPAELYADSEAVCRRHPVAVAAGAMVLGALVSRFIKGSSRPSA